MSGAIRKAVKPPSAEEQLILEDFKERILDLETALRVGQIKWFDPFFVDGVEVFIGNSPLHGKAIYAGSNNVKGVAWRLKLKICEKMKTMGLI